ncbi:MAG: FIST N-terminal domain-containing protein [Comamonas sp.]
MKLFPHAHATHPQWPLAAGLALAQLRAQMALPDYAATPALGLLYVTEPYAGQLQDLVDWLAAELPHVTDWAGCVGIGVIAGEAQYTEEPALAVMLCDLGAHDYRVFSGVSPLPPQYAATTMLLHADARTVDLPELVAELAGRTQSGGVYGGLVASRVQPTQVAWSSHGQLPGQAGRSRAVFDGGISGVAFGPAVPWLARVAGGSRAMGPRHRITAVQGQLVTRLDGQPALQVLLQDAALPLDASLQARSDLVALLRETQVRIEPPAGDAPHPGEQAGLNSPDGPDGAIEPPEHAVIGIDMGQHGLVIAEGQGMLRPGMDLTFCQRDAQSARRDLVRAGTALRAAFEPADMSAGQAQALAEDLDGLPQAGSGIAGAVYVNCISRGGSYFGAPRADLLLLRRALGHVPLIGVLSAGEIAGGQLRRHTGVLMAFGAD